MTIKPVGFSGGGKQALEPVEVRPGEIVEQVAEFTPGAVSVRITENGRLTDASVSVHPAGGGVAVSQGRLYPRPKTNPRRFELAVGRYDVKVKAKAIRLKGSAPQQTGVTVEAGGSAEARLDFAVGSE
jgi:hypothetical protein